ncbi:hypothetical protein AB4Y96_10885 [Phyllobacterium sp. TAF24]|uniref:hypothetical protein n=1 Tax=Phyllobacterium sp. TAF24 TaxID=3233068 RepID=UPI003EB0B108
MKFATGFVLALVLFVAGCQTITPEERRAIDSRTCSSYGFKPKSEAFARCLLDLELDRRATSRAQFDDMRFNNPPIIFYGGRHYRW